MRSLLVQPPPAMKSRQRGLQIYAGKLKECPTASSSTEPKCQLHPLEGVLVTPQENALRFVCKLYITVHLEMSCCRYLH